MEDMCCVWMYVNVGINQWCKYVQYDKTHKKFQTSVLLIKNLYERIRMKTTEARDGRRMWVYIYTILESSSLKNYMDISLFVKNISILAITFFIIIRYNKLQ